MTSYQSFLQGYYLKYIQLHDTCFIQTFNFKSHSMFHFIVVSSFSSYLFNIFNATYLFSFFLGSYSQTFCGSDILLSYFIILKYSYSRSFISFIIFCCSLIYFSYFSIIHYFWDFFILL